MTTYKDILIKGIKKIESVEQTIEEEIDKSVTLEDIALDDIQSIENVEKSVEKEIPSMTVPMQSLEYVEDQVINTIENVENIEICSNELIEQAEVIEEYFVTKFLNYMLSYLPKM